MENNIIKNIDKKVFLQYIKMGLIGDRLCPETNGLLGIGDYYFIGEERYVYDEKVADRVCLRDYGMTYLELYNSQDEDTVEVYYSCVEDAEEVLDNIIEQGYYYNDILSIPMSNFNVRSFDTLLQILINHIKETPSHFLYGICNSILLLSRTKIFSYEETFYLDDILDANKPTKDNEFKEFYHSKYWTDVPYWWVPTKQSLETKQIRIDYLTKLKEVLLKKYD